MNVLIVDDSRVFRSIVRECIEGIDSVTVVGSVWSGEKAIEFIIDHDIDLITLDIEMPSLNGIETIHRLKTMVHDGKIPQMPAVIMLSSLTDDNRSSTMRALELGAFDFIQKNSSDNPNQKEYLEQEFTRVITAIQSNNKHLLQNHRQNPKSIDISHLSSLKKKTEQGTLEYIVIGVSTGGPKALVAMLPKLSRVVQCPILIVQHMPPIFTESLAQNLNKICDHTVVESHGGEEVIGRKIFIAPGGKHLVIRKKGQKIVTSLNGEPLESGCRPSVNVLFRSAATAVGSKCIAIILTGMGVDGTAALRPLKRSGATIIVQDEQTSVVWGMPGSAVETGLVDRVLPLLRIPSEVKTLMKGV